MNLSKRQCPCQSDTEKKSSYENCCSVFHKGIFAPTPLELMRSRYSAYILENEAYLLDTWHPSTRPHDPLFKDPGPKWLELKIIKNSISQDQSSGEVEFIATYRIHGKAHKLHEISQFKKENGQWYYVDGTFLN